MWTEDEVVEEQVAHLYLYERVATHVTSLIESGTLVAGDRLPSVRSLSREQNISISTVLQAYRLLEDRGLVEARPQSGFYVRAQQMQRLPEPERSSPPRTPGKVKVEDLILEVLEVIADPEVVPLGAAVPSPELLPTARLSRSLSRVARHRRNAAATYMVPQGSPELRHELARRALYWGGRLSSDDFIVTSGCMEALMLCLRAVAKPGDTIAVESPTYFGVLQLVAGLNMRALEIPTHPQYGLCLNDAAEALEREPIAAFLVMPNFNNPLGSLMPEENKKRLLALLEERDIPLIEDDLYGELHFGDTRPRPIKAYDRRGLVLHCSSFSKTLSPGYRVGYAAPGRFLHQVKRLKVATTLDTNVLAQLAIADYLQRGGYDHHLRRLRRRLARSMDRMTRAVMNYFPAGTRVTRPQGGFVLWVELPDKTDALSLYQAALEKNISIAPGPIFSPCGSYPNFVRLNCGHPWSERLDKALEQLGKLAHEMIR